MNHPQPKYRYYCVDCRVYHYGEHVCMKQDMVNQPPHYVGEIECIDAMVSAFGLEAVKTYARIAAFKYLWRAGKKDAMAQELGKAVWYLRFANGDDPRAS